MSEQTKKNLRKARIEFEIDDDDRDEIKKVSKDIGITSAALERIAIKRYSKDIYKLNAEQDELEVK